MKKMIFIIVTFLIAVGCSNIGHQEIAREINFSNSLNILSEDSNKYIFIGYQNLQIIEPLIKHCNNTLDSLCEKWTLKSIDLEGILEEMTKVDSHIWYSKCYILPCYFTTTVKNKHEKYTLSIHPGSYIILSNEKETLHFISEKKLDHFIFPCDCCEYDVLQQTE